MTNDFSDIANLLADEDDESAPLLDEDDIEEVIAASSVKPVMSPSVEEDVMNALAQYRHKEKWEQWGMDRLRKQGSAILLEGPPGTGKTSIARWMSRQLKKGFVELDASKVASVDPGQSERGVHVFFDKARKRKNAVIFMDECDHILMDRSQIGSAGMTWQLGMVEALMVEINVYPGLVICATNHPSLLDPALSDRFIAIVHVGKPDRTMRYRLWKVKIPKKFPFQPTKLQLNELSRVELTGRQIENVIVNVASDAIEKEIKPMMKAFHFFIERECSKRIPE